MGLKAVIDTGTTAVATTVSITNDTTTNATMYPTWVTTTSGNLPLKVSSTKITFNPSSGLLSTTALALTTPLPLASGGVGSGTAAGALVNLTLPPTAAAMGPYRSGRSYMVGFGSVNTSTTNTSTLVTDTIYGVLGGINAPTTITALSMRTSSSNASVGASVKFAVYALAADGTPSTRLGLTTVGVSIGDSATNTIVTGTFDSAIVLPAGVYLFAVLPTAVTTAVRAMLYTSTAAWMTATGAATPSACMSQTPVVGYSGAASYATGMPSPFGSSSVITTITNLPAMAFTVQ